MNSEQLKSLLRSAIIAVFGGIGGIGVAKGWYSAEKLAAFLNSEIVSSVIAIMITAAWGIWAKTKIGLLTASANMAPETTTIAPTSLAKAVSATNVVSAGSPAAKEAVK